AGYCAVPAAMAEDAAWVASGTTAEFEGTVPWLYREGGNATINSDDAGHIKVASDGKGTRPAGSETDKRLYSGDTITLGWDIGDNPRATVSSVTLTSTALDATTQAAKVKKGEAAPVVVTVKDSAGKPVPNVAFTLKRGDAVPRNSGATLYGDVAAMDDMTVQPASGTVVT
uniref:Immunoglobulin-like domain BIg-containing protein n=1 Tax=Shigella flexneri TaxID=623 RepID=UPI003FA7E7C1